MGIRRRKVKKTERNSWCVNWLKVVKRLSPWSKSSNPIPGDHFSNELTTLDDFGWAMQWRMKVEKKIRSSSWRARPLDTSGRKDVLITRAFGFFLELPFRPNRVGAKRGKNASVGKVHKISLCINLFSWYNRELLHFSPSSTKWIRWNKKKTTNKLSTFLFYWKMDF